MMKKLLKKLTNRVPGVLFVIIIFTLFPHNIVEAVDFESKVSLTYSISSDGVMHIKEVRTTKNNSSEFYIKGDSYEVFVISAFKTRSSVSREDLEKVAETIKVTNSAGAVLIPQIEIGDKQIEVKVAFGTDLNKGNQRVLVLEYDNFELVEKNGNVWNIYMQRMSEEFNQITTSDNGATTQTSFTIVLELDKLLGNPNFVLPEPLDFSESSEIITYIFDPISLVDQSAWIQIGDKQYYSFEITQPVKASLDLSSKIFYTFYDLILPRESDSENQKVYFQSIVPQPEYVKLDGEGNVVARFRFTNEQETEINVKGFISTNMTDKVTKEDVGQVDDIDLTAEYALIEGDKVKLEGLLAPSLYWEVDDEEIQIVADDLKGDMTNVFDILFADYTFVIDNVDYDNLKTGIDNQRFGALETLKGGSSVCMEFSDLLITLLRAQGIPARAAFGYGFDPRSEGETEEGHQWVEVYMPNIGWVPVDPTWGDTGRRSYIGSDIDHALWRVASRNVEIPSPITKYSILDDGDLEPPKFEIKVVESIDNVNLMTLDDLLEQYEYSPKHKIIDKFDQLNNYGKVVFIGIPGILILVVAFSFLLAVIKFMKKFVQKSITRVNSR